MTVRQLQGVDSLADEDLVGRFLAGRDERFFAALVRRHVPGIHAFLRGNGVEDEHVDDVAQEVFIGLYSSLERWRGDAPLAAWLYAIAWRQTRKFRRGMLLRGKLRPAARRAEAADPLDAVPARGVDAHAALAAGEDRAAVRAALATLPPRQRAALTLRYWDGMKLEEVAATLGIAVGTAKATVFKGLRNMEKILGGDDVRTT